MQTAKVRCSGGLLCELLTCCIIDEELCSPRPQIVMMPRRPVRLCGVADVACRVSCRRFRWRLRESARNFDHFRHPAEALMQESRSACLHRTSSLCASEDLGLGCAAVLHLLQVPLTSGA